MNRQRALNALVGLAAAFGVVAVPLVLDNIYWTSVLTLVVINSLMAATLRMIFLIGELALGLVGFMCVGAYTSALLSMKAGIPFSLSLPAGAFLAGLVAFTVGYPFMRVKGIYFVILTVVTSESFRMLAIHWERLTGGTNGLVGFPGAGILNLPGLGEVDFTSFNAYYYLTLAIVCVSLYILYRLERSNFGLTWLAMRETEKMAGAVGINVLRYKVINFSVACFFAGLGGGLLAHSERTLSPNASSAFGLMTAIYLLVYMIVGGKSHFMGPIIGTFVLSLISEFARPMQEYQPMLIGALAIAVVMILPDGLVSLPDRLWRLVAVHRKSRVAQGQRPG
jgi:branched-chain amino acid transport system permease protein